jgi:hypothetical protein
MPIRLLTINYEPFTKKPPRFPPFMVEVAEPSRNPTWSHRVALSQTSLFGVKPGLILPGILAKSLEMNMLHLKTHLDRVFTELNMFQTSQSRPLASAGRQIVEKMIWRMRPLRLCSPFLGPLRPGWNGLKFRLRVKAGGHNNTKLNPVFRGMVCRLVGAG